MQPSGSRRDVVAVTNLAEFFRDSLRGAVAEQRFTLEEQTETYVVNLLTLFARAERLYESAPDTRRMRPLAEMLFEALGAATATERDLALQRLGDVSLFVAGFLARGFARRLVDVDYHIAMGGGPTVPWPARSTADGRAPLRGCSPSWRPSSASWWTPWARSATPRTSTRSETSSGSTKSG
jgi:hypothetical protein